MTLALWVYLLIGILTWISLGYHTLTISKLHSVTNSTMTGVKDGKLNSMENQSMTTDRDEELRRAIQNFEDAYLYLNSFKTEYNIVVRYRADYLSRYREVPRYTPDPIFLDEKGVKVKATQTRAVIV